jgi:hypothetical protein
MFAAGGGDGIMKRFMGAALAIGLAWAAGVASAQPAGQQEDKSQGSLLLATLVGGQSPTLSAAQKAVLAGYRAGKSNAKSGKITVAVDKIGCTAGGKAETSFACDLAFGAKTIHLTARDASQVFAALEMIGAWSNAPFGPHAASATRVICTLDAAVIAGGNDGGADCTYTPAAGPAPPAAASPPTKVDDDSSLLVAALVGGASPTLGVGDKAALTHYLAGQPAPDARLAKFAVTANQVLCTSSNRSEITWSCDLTFGARKVHLAGAAAAELYADLMLTGLSGQAAMGTDEVGTKPLACTIDPAAIAAQTGGAACTLAESEF